MSDYPARVYVTAPTDGKPARVSSIRHADQVEYIRADVAMAAVMLASVAAAGEIDEAKLLGVCNAAMTKVLEAFP